MPESIVERHRRWGLEAFLRRYPGLRILPTAGDSLEVGGRLRFHLQGPSEGPIEDVYEVLIRFPADFPAGIPTAFEKGGRIPRSHHTQPDGSLCLGADTELRLKLRAGSTLDRFIEEVLVPYLFQFSFFEKHGRMPFGELRHGVLGLLDYFCDLYKVSNGRAGKELVRLTSLKRRRANKVPCPCGSGRRLGQCHNRTVNALRRELGRKWFAEEFKTLGA
jgi:SEC-C motif